MFHLKVNSKVKKSTHIKVLVLNCSGNVWLYRLTWVGLESVIIIAEQNWSNYIQKLYLGKVFDNFTILDYSLASHWH